MHSIFYPLDKKTRISEECNKDVKFASREPNYFIASNCFMEPQYAEIFQALQAGTIL
jgi:hypothetical protein